MPDLFAASSSTHAPCESGCSWEMFSLHLGTGCVESGVWIFIPFGFSFSRCVLSVWVHASVSLSSCPLTADGCSSVVLRQSCCCSWSSVFIYCKTNDSVRINPEWSGIYTVCVCTFGSVCMLWWGSNTRCSLTLYFPLTSKGGSQSLTSGAKNPVHPAMAVPHAVSSVFEVLDPVSGQGQLRRVITVAGVGVPVEVTEGPLNHTKETIHIAHYKFWCIHWRVPQDPRNNIVCCAHTRLFVHLWGRIKGIKHINIGKGESRSLKSMMT